MIDEPEPGEVDGAWALVAARRADELESGAVRALTREEADEYLDARSAASRD
ncbi:addiction module protein [Brachybacterium sp. AOP3-A1-3]|uniref:addiction module protein n=1 Tax=Brachybacterium sp. AOP3-A1-3 TaxID=3457699 RepID=UPI00403326E2